MVWCQERKDAACYIEHVINSNINTVIFTFYRWNIRYCPELHAQKKRNSTLIPNKPMSPEASPITEITVNEHQLFYNKERDMHKIQFQALNDFIIFLSSLSEKLSGLTVIFFTPVSIPIVE